MHAWPPEARNRTHLARLDQLLGEAAAAAPDAAFLLTADHGMNFKSRCWDLEKVCARRGAPIRIAISVERDKYPKHHRGHGGVSWVYCKSVREVDRVARVLSGIEGVERVLTLATRYGGFTWDGFANWRSGGAATRYCIRRTGFESQALPARVPDPLPAA